MTKYVYLFKEGNASMRNLLGGKGANLAEMTKIGRPVPQGFTVTTEAGTRYYDCRLYTSIKASGIIRQKSDSNTAAVRHTALPHPDR